MYWPRPLRRQVPLALDELNRTLCDSRHLQLEMELRPLMAKLKRSGPSRVERRKRNGMVISGSLRNSRRS